MAELQPINHLVAPTTIAPSMHSIVLQRFDVQSNWGTGNIMFLKFAAAALVAVLAFGMGGSLASASTVTVSMTAP